MPEGKTKSPTLGKLSGERISLRPFRLADEPAIWAAWTASAGSSSRPGFPSRKRLHERILASGDFHRGSLDVAIEAAGSLIGDIQARQGIGQRLPPGVVELGIEIYDAGRRGRGHGREAIALMTRWLFQQGVADRVQASTAKDNIAMRRVLEHLGFTFEGVMRDFMPAGTRREDFALYAIIRSDWYHRHELEGSSLSRSPVSTA